MELYTLDGLLRRSQLVEIFESLIWTERFAQYGDFDLQLPSTPVNRSLLIPGTMLALDTSYRVMRIETIEDTVDRDGKATLNIKGRSLEAMLEERVAKNPFIDTTDNTWGLSGTPAAIARQIFSEICESGNLSPYDIIPFLTPGNIFPTDTIPEPATSISIELKLTTVYAAIKNLCDIYDLGFRLIRNLDTSQLYFNIYAGNDLTTEQFIRDPVVFSIEHDTLQSTKEFKTNQPYRNIAYVYSQGFGKAIVAADGVAATISGFARRVLLVEASEIKVDTPDIPGALQLKGKEELTKTRSFTAFDGELNRASPYIYGEHYILGDVVEFRNADSLVTYKRVTEQIFVRDREGDRSYPTLSMLTSVAP